MPIKKCVLYSTAIAFLILVAAPPRIFPQNAGSLMSEGWQLAQAKQLDAALDCFNRAITLDPSNGWAYRAAGWVLKEQKKIAESLPYYKKAISFMPDEPLLWIEQAFAYRDHQEYTNAIVSIDAGLQRYKKQSKNPPEWVFSSASHIYREKLKNPQKSMQYLNEGLLLFPKAVNIHLEMGLALGSMKKYPQALESFNRAHEIYEEQKNPPPGWLPLTIAAYHLYHLDPASPKEAVPYLYELLKGDFSQEQKDTAADWLAYTYYQLKQWDRYVPLAAEYVKTGKNKDAVKAHLERLTHHFFDQGNLSEALRYGKERGNDFWITKMLLPRTVVLKGTFHLKKIMATYYPSTKAGMVAMPMPIDSAYQSFVSLKSSSEYNKIEKDGRYNLAWFDFGKGYPDIITLEITLKNQVVNNRPGMMKSCGPDPEGNCYYANHKDAYFDFDSLPVEAGVRSITKDSSDDMERALSLHRWVSENVTHILKIPEYQKKMPDGSIVFDTSKIPQYHKISEIYQRKIGHCHHISNLFIGMCRAAHIPARKIWGITISADVQKTAGICGEHYVAEMYDPGADSWFYVEPQDAKFFGINQFWHIIFITDELARKHQHLIDLVDIRWMEFYNLGNTGCMSYTVNYE